MLSRYAERVHLLGGDGHHVASPLGAWLVVALAATTAEGPVAGEIEDALGVDGREASAFAGRLLADPHPQVASGAAVWHGPVQSSERLAAWKATLPREIETGDIPTQATLDQWAERSTRGLITKFPITITPEVLLLIATALGTKVSWEVPFTLVPGTSLGSASSWSPELERVLATPADPRHRQFIADTDRAGLVAIHIAEARGGVMVSSVMAGADVPARDVLAAAHAIAATEAVERGRVARHSLFDLPLGDSDLGGIREESAETAGGRNEERCEAVLPAWSVETKLNLNNTALGIPAAASALAGMLGLNDYRYEARQAAVARYSRVGFEVAAITGLSVATAGRPPLQPGRRRVATLRFGRPFAAVAVTVDTYPRPTGPHTPWHGLPVFSAWITEPVDAQSD